jgi:hypothetical protein
MIKGIHLFVDDVLNVAQPFPVTESLVIIRIEMMRD